MTSLELLNTPDDLMSQKPSVKVHHIIAYSNLCGEEDDTEYVEDDDNTFDDNSLYNPQGVNGVLYRMYVSRPIVEPFDNFDASEVDLDLGGGNLQSFSGQRKSSFGGDMSVMRTSADCDACSSANGMKSKK